MAEITVELEAVGCAENGKRFEIIEHHTKGIVSRMQQHIRNWITRNADALRVFWMVFLLIAYFVYLGFAVSYSFEGSLTLIVFTALTITAVFYKFIRDKYGTRIYHSILHPIFNTWDNLWPITKWFVRICIYARKKNQLGNWMTDKNWQQYPCKTLLVLPMNVFSAFMSTFLSGGFKRHPM